MKNILVVLFSLVLALPAAAQITATSTRENVRERIQNVGAEARQAIENIRQATRESIQAEKEAFQKTIGDKRMELQNSIQAHRDALKAKIANIRDEQKKITVERIDQDIAALNAVMTSHYANVLDQISDILKRIVSRTDTAQANGRDVTAVRTAIANAQTAIASARAAVVAQVAKTYSLNITTDTALKNNVGATRQTLRDDLKKAADSVKAAREAVRQAATTLAQIPGVDDLKEATSTTTSTNQ